MLRLEARNSQVPIEKKPPWIKTRLRTGPEYTELKKLVRREGLHTVCEEAGCPNIFECWEDREATFLIGGDQCTRRCDFCQIDTGRPQPLDTDEPRRVAESVATMGLAYATVTGVARDDLPDGGAWLYAQTAREIHAAVPGCGVELLIPDFNAEPDRLAEVFGARPEVLGHNIETVPRIFRRIRPGFRYERSLGVLTQARAAGLVTKSNLILGMGEERHEISAAMADLHAAGCDLLTITQYLRPTPRHHPVERWVKPEEFVELREEAEDIGFAGVMSGPLVRSSYRAGRSTGRRCSARVTARRSLPAGVTGHLRGLRRGAHTGPANRALRPVSGRCVGEVPPRGAKRMRGVPGGRPPRPTTAVFHLGSGTHILPCMAKQKNADDEATPGRIQQIRMVAGLVHKANPRALPIVIGSGLGVLVILVVVGLLTGQAGFLIPLGVLFGILVAIFLFGRFAQSAQYSTIEGQPGAAAAVLQSMRGNWSVTPAIAANRNMDVVHRAVRPARRGPGRRGLPRRGCPACSPPRRSASPGSRSTCRSSTSRLATPRARSRSGSCSERS